MSYVHPQAICETVTIGQGTRVWAFAHILPGAKIGTDCNICDGVFIENDVIVGDRVTVKCGVQLWDGTEIGSDVFIGPNVTFTNDAFPRSKVYPEAFSKTIIEDRASIGANATILPGLRIGYAAMVGAGAVVLDEVPARAIVVGNPGRVVGFAGAEKCQTSQLPEDFPGKALPWASHRSESGRLLVSEHLPFPVKRIFTIDQVKHRHARGAHAHKACHQLLKVNSGTVDVVVDDGVRAFHLHLEDPGVLIYMPPRTWGMQFSYSRDASLIVFASHPYDPDDYIYSYQAFRDAGGLG